MLLLFVCLLLSGNKLKAQELSQGYLDSAKIFFRAFTTNFSIYETNIVQDYSSDSNNLSYKYMIQLGEESLRKSSLRIFNSAFKTTQAALDSLILSKWELSSIFQKAKNSKKFKMPGAFFPRTTVAPIREISDSLRNVIPTPAIWTFTLPCFIRNGTLAACYYIHHNIKGSGDGGLILFKNENGYWVKFGKDVYMQF
ncbi:MAG: hypothetical protein JWQ38_1568 [Flavipsychrobacter sp.]|nr:hypothetical protein [Flavipsychrobacter sp.]